MIVCGCMLLVGVFVGSWRCVVVCRVVVIGLLFELVEVVGIGLLLCVF